MRLAWITLFAAGAAAGIVAAACSSDEASCIGAACATQQPVAPVFAGVEWVAPDAEGHLVLGWKSATSARTPPERMRYRIYATTLEGRSLSFPSVLTTEYGATRATVRVTPMRERHFIAVRAVDENDTEDANAVEQVGLASPDTLPPGFSGIGTIRPEPGTGVYIAWEAAHDDQTPEAGIIYEVYRGADGKPVDYTTPVRVLEGIREVTLTDLGSPNTPQTFVVRARDRAGHTDGNTNQKITALGPDVKPPTFGGCASVTTTATTLTATWAAATDDYTTPAEMAYDVYVATAAGAQSYQGTPTVSVVGQTSVTLRDQTPGKNLYVVCRARDSARNNDGNTIERVVTTLDDSTPPVFAGINAPPVVDDIGRRVTFTWDPATDDRTAASDIVYDVYEAFTTRGQAFSGPPRASSAPGATSVVVSDLASRSTLYWVVRARDRAGNRDGNILERTGSTKVSFALDVQPILSRSCAVIGCHVSGAPPAGLNMIPALARASLVNTLAVERMSGSSGQTKLLRVAPGAATDSYLYYKITGLMYPLLVPDGGGATVPLTIAGNLMPAPATGNTLSAEQKAIVTDWINQGAQDN